MSKAVKTAMKKERVKDTKGLAAAKKATTMTSEQWKKLQIGMKEKWPQPEYMAQEHPEGKGHTCYRDETFEKVTRWRAETKIQYRPHAKAPGSKSHVRYEKYSKATTVGQALKLGSWPADWCWDYERGYIKVLGPVRDEPIDISNTADDKDFTDVDRAVFQWYRRELAKKLGLTLEEIMNGKGGQETTIMRAHRLVAQRLCRKVLREASEKKRKITDQEVTDVLKDWAFARNVTRVNVMQKHQTWVWSDTLGLLRDRIGDIHLTNSTKNYPEFVQVLTKWLTDRLPPEAKDFKFTSLNVNRDYAAKTHRDGNNFGPSMISAFGSFSGGELNYWAEDDGKADLENLGSKGKVQFDLSKNLALFNGNCAHSVEDFEGNRFSIVYFTLGCHAKMKDEDRTAMASLGIPVPAKDEDPYTIIRPPQGNRRIPTPCRDGSRKSLPPSHSWPKSKLSSGAAKPFKFVPAQPSIDSKAAKAKSSISKKSNASKAMTGKQQNKKRASSAE